jgi:hypothetical protein
MAILRTGNGASPTAPPPGQAEPAKPGVPPEDPVRSRARKRLEDRRGLWTHVAFYVIVNALLIGIWLVNGGGYFWPGWILTIWGIALIMHGWDFFWRWIRPITEADVDAEVERGHRHQ